jgi:acetyl esterase/lipase
MSALLPHGAQHAAPQGLARPPFDPAFKYAGGLPGFSDELKLEVVRGHSSADSVDSVLNKFPHFDHVEYNVPPVKELDNHSTVISIFRSKSSTNTKKAVLYYVHGGGQVGGNRFSGLDSVINLLPNNDDVIFASIEYRLAPEHRAPAGTYEC